ncbi:sodium/calcium exchanger NCL2-like [Cornus florida]|uniref:sodium/calcium exchanger NCL2-like n=1 Tax=Cornus florida TaxID=4283 RepID=UPI00289E8B83|nr:sodium/calcium exchanger NCL2-like [Cornus florida]
MGNFSKTAYCALLLLLVLPFLRVTAGRSLRYSSTQLVSDGVDDVRETQPPSSILRRKGIDSAEECEQMYGFLPCSNSMIGHLFLIVVYEFLLFHGESYVASGGERIFKILGPGVFGASAFHVLGALPESLILLASGLLNNKETAQEFVLTGVGLLAGSTIFLLTVLWGTCLIVGSQDFPNTSGPYTLVGSNPTQNSFQKLLSSLTGYGISTDSETTYMARIMVLSVIPFIIIQIPLVFGLSSSAERVVIITSLVVSVVFLLLYFFYQFFQPWIQKRRLEYVKHEHFVLDILKHLQKRTIQKLITDNGSPNVSAIRRLFEEIDQDDDDLISFAELKELLLEIRFRKSDLDKDKAIEKVMEEFDLDGDKKITEDEFVTGFTKWLDETKHALDKRFLSRKSLQDVYQIFQPWIQKKRKEHEMKKTLIAGILAHVQSYALGSLFTEDGTPDIPAIKRLFVTFDRDGDNSISQPELKELIADIKFGKVSLDADEAVAKIMEELDVNQDQMINEEEFVNGFSKWLSSSNIHTPKSAESEDDIYQRTWEETDMLMDERSVDKSPWAWIKAIMLLVVGIVILAVLAEPLIESVENFSNAASLPSFFISFILVPLATNARVATSAIKASSRKKPRTTSLTFSEIYGGVFMNNILGFSVLLSIIYFRGLSWDFSAELLVVLIVSATMGLASSFISSFPLCTSVGAYLLYPLSLLLVYLL